MTPHHVPAVRNGDAALFDNRDHPKFGFAQKDVKKSRCRGQGRRALRGYDACVRVLVSCLCAYFACFAL